MATDDFQITQGEMHRLKEAMKDKQFVDLLVEYTKEISDPENRKKYEEDIIAMEKERGSNVRLLTPEPGFLVKTTRLSDGMKVFVNICTSSEIQDCSIIAETRNGNQGTHVSLPHSLSPMRKDVDKASKSCLVFDVCFHPNSYAKSLGDQKLKELLIDTALDILEKQGNIVVNRKLKRFPKMKYKGIPQTNIIRSISTEGDSNPNYLAPVNGTKSDVANKMKKTITKSTKLKEDTVLDAGSSIVVDSEKDSSHHLVTNNVPQYKIIHRGYFDMQDFTNAKESGSTVPMELVVKIYLPLAKSAADIDLDIFETDLVLHSEEPPYHLEVQLPYNVNSIEGQAQFDTVEKVLSVTLPVVNIK